jgi:hypothetical protein
MRWMMGRAMLALFGLGQHYLMHTLRAPGLAVFLLVATGVSPVLAMLPEGSTNSPSDVYASARAGFDASFPQCGKSIPSSSSNGMVYGFAILGVNGGQEFTPNPCLAVQYGRGGETGSSPAFYIDLNSPTPATAIFGQFGPKGLCGETNAACQSYNFGYNGAQTAFAYAMASVGTAAAASGVWWLDVETGKPWSANPGDNAQVIQGSIDYFHDHSLTVGAYSVLWMWNQIAGREYRPGIPAWISGGKSLTAAPQLCTAESFTGGPIWVVQVPRQNYDEDYGC